MTKYIKGKDGKFAGSIGNGKNKFPSFIPTPTTHLAPSDSTMGNTSFISPSTISPHIADHFGELPDLTASDIHVSEWGFTQPDVKTREGWDIPPAQEQIYADSRGFLDSLSAMCERPELVRTPEKGVQVGPGQFDYSIQMCERYSKSYSSHAQNLWEQGLHHQASSYYTMSQLADQAAKLGYRNRALWSNQENHLNENHTDGTTPVEWDNSVLQKALHKCLDSCFTHVPYEKAKQLVRNTSSGAVLMDYMAVGGGDPDVAIIAAGLMGNPHENKKF
jgi:hypothetical protein